MRLAWFSPMPPVTTGIARVSADLVAALGDEHDIDVFVDVGNLDPTGDPARPWRSAHEFIPRHHQRPYDLPVYQLGNSSHHDFEWPYLFRYPGLVVLHDAHLHHARAACLLRTLRADDYRAEFAANHPEAAPGLAELAAAGFDSHIHYSWPMTRLVAEASRVAAVHSPAAADRLRAGAPGARVEVIRLGHGERLAADRAAVLGEHARRRYGIPGDAILFGCFGGLSPDKRLPQVLAAFEATRAYAPYARLLLAGSVASHFDLRGEIDRRGLGPYCTVTGYLESDEQLTGCIAACDATLNLRWPTAREVSGPWLRCLAAGKPTVTIDLAHMTHVPSLDPRTWRAPRGQVADPCTIAIDILDEDHSLRLAMRRLALDATLRETLGRAAQVYWSAHHTPAAMAADYRRVIALAAAIEPAARTLPAHLLNTGAGTLRHVMQELGVPVPFAV